ncbi:hypothetical protein FHX42_005243 [Saccharopolyspora lacisalsi]|uniref:Uncharacterized protein n=1 Tax=Halosaccharopolyspora lacisalsi TaxID=1000566 RepID=A0A839E5D7_9PSEU|nr:hypothetical protein [Halosaccharopolyspora lacisalsi]MBA8827836.1 hypothetical protein [Halosaccharopolyspora lacisalsi]
MNTDHPRPGRPPLPIDWEAENAVHNAEHADFTKRSRNAMMQMFLSNGYTPEQAQHEVDKHDQRTTAIGEAMQSAVNDRMPTCGDTDPSSPRPDQQPVTEYAPETRAEPTEPAAPRPRPYIEECDQEPEMRMPVMPGAFSRALSSPGHWLKAFGLALFTGGAVFLLLAGLLHWLFGTAALVTWVTGIIAGIGALPVLMATLSAASREVREWVRVGGPKPIRWW